MLHRFGNYIGEAEESEDEQPQAGRAPIDSYVDDEELEDGADHGDQQLMEVDGMRLVHISRHGKS